MNEDATIEDAPPSAKLVYKVLQYNGELTQKEVVERSMLSQRTVRDAIDRLEALGLVSEEVYIRDARQSLYVLTPGSSADAEAAPPVPSSGHSD